MPIPTARAGDENRPDVSFGVDHAGRVDRDEVGADAYTTGIGNDVLLCQLPGDGLGRNAELRHAIAVKLHIDDLGLVTDDVDFGHVVDEQQFAPQ